MLLKIQRSLSNGRRSTTSRCHCVCLGKNPANTNMTCANLWISLDLAAPPSCQCTPAPGWPAGRGSVPHADEIVADAVRVGPARRSKAQPAHDPKDAARLFGEMTPEFAAGFLSRMRPEAAAAVPMSVLWGERDSAFQLPILERWQGTFPHARVVRFPDAGHWPHEEVPAAFCAALTD